jgi:UDP:flavonoid glycosyltransferase YjiC (YdhE family)
MRALFTSLPAMGHLNSILPLAIAARRAGHDVAVCTSAGLVDEVTGHGLEHLPGGALTLDELLPADVPRYGPDRTARVRLEVFAKAAPVRLMADLEPHVRDWRPDVLIRESAEYAACVLAERIGLPHAAVATGSQSARFDHRLLFLPALHELRDRYGLGPDPDVEMPSRYLAFSLMPPSWDGDAAVAPTLHHIRYEPPVRPDAGDFDLPPGDGPLVLVALGTLFHRAPGLLEAIIEALAPLPVRLLVAAGRDHDPARFGAVPDNVTVVPWVPQVAVLGSASLFVTHGGFNSTKEALSQGVPLVVIPLGADQYHTAERVQAIGLGLAVGPEDHSVATIRDRARRVLAEPTYARRAARFAAETAALPPLDEEVRLLEALAAHRWPIRRTLD